MSATGPPALGEGPPAAAPALASPTAQPREACPLCGAPLAPDQEWCLRCGAAARTRLAASPNWRAPLAAIFLVVVLSLGVLAAALVKLAGDTGPAPPPSTTTLTTAAVAPATTPTSAVPGSPLPGTTTTAPATTSTSPTTARTTTPPTNTSKLPKAKLKLGGIGTSGSNIPRLPGVSRAIEEQIRKRFTKAGK